MIFKLKIKKQINNKKAQISLEYILIFISLLVVFGTIFITTTNIYNKNLEIIDNKELKNNSEYIQKIIDFQELQVNSLYKVQINPEECWNFIKINNNSFYLENKNKRYKINSNYKINIENTEICKKTIINIKLLEEEISFIFYKN
jgi:hypothetical protein